MIYLNSKIQYERIYYIGDVMSQKTEQFKEFVKAHPGLKKLVYEKNKSWQSLFEEWTLFGDSKVWNMYENESINTNSAETKEDETINKNIPVSKEVSQIGDIVKKCVDYAKKINPDTVSKTVNNIQKVMSLVAGLGAVNTAKAASTNKMTGDPLFDQRFDEWY